MTMPCLVDRYLCFPDCKNLASHFCSLINTVALYSYTLDSTGQLQPRSAHLDPVEESELLCSELSDSVKDLTSPPLSAETVEGVDTWVFPTVQMGPLGIRQDEQAMLWLLKQLPTGTDMHLSSPYFNLTPAYEDAILEAAREKSVHILTASPKVPLNLPSHTHQSELHLKSKFLFICGHLMKVHLLWLQHSCQYGSMFFFIISTWKHLF